MILCDITDASIRFELQALDSDLLLPDSRLCDIVAVHHQCSVLSQNMPQV